MTEKKKSSPIGCLILLLVIVPLFFFVPLGVAIGFAVVCIMILFIIPEIDREFRKLKKRKITNKSTIRAAQPGFVELVAKIQTESHTTWLTNEPADFIEIIFLKVKHNKYEENDKVLFYQNRTAKRWFKISDGSGDAWVSLHHSTRLIVTKRKTLKRKTLLNLLKEKPLPDFPFEELEDKKLFWVEEQYIPANNPVYFYGIMNKLSSEKDAAYLMEHGKNLKAIHAENMYALHVEDWEMIQKDSGGGEVRMLSSDYSPETYIENLVISLKGDSYLRIRSIFSIIFLFIAIFVLIGFFGIYLWKAHPVFFEKVMEFLNL